jgi:hypothetical protein
MSEREQSYDEKAQEIKESDSEGAARQGDDEATETERADK